LRSWIQLQDVSNGWHFESGLESSNLICCGVLSIVVELSNRFDATRVDFDSMDSFYSHRLVSSEIETLVMSMILPQLFWYICPLSYIYRLSSVFVVVDDVNDCRVPMLGSGFTYKQPLFSEAPYVTPFVLLKPRQPTTTSTIETPVNGSAQNGLCLLLSSMGPSLTPYQQ
jgi:hypothetical protein